MTATPNHPARHPATTATSRGGRRLSAILACAVLAAVAAIPAAAVAAPELKVSLTPEVSEVQVLTVSGIAGEFRLRFGDGGPGVSETADLPVGASAQQVEDALNALSNINAGGGSVRVPADEHVNNHTYRIVFDGGPLAGTDVPALVAVDGTTALSSPFADRFRVDTVEQPGVRRSDDRVNYIVEVFNGAGTSISAGETIVCNPFSNGGSSPAYTFEWRRNGVVIAGETSDSYTTVSPDDEGAVIQCQVTATNTVPDVNSGGFAAMSGIDEGTVVVDPPPADSPPVPPSGLLAQPTPDGNAPAGTVLTCDPGVWQGVTEPFAYQWYVSGAIVAGETGSTYAVQAADVPGTVQCAVTGSNGETAITKFSNRRRTSPAPSPPEPFGVGADLVHPDVTSGPVTLEVELPDGLDTVAFSAFDPDGGAFVDNAAPVGWSCSLHQATVFVPAKVTCSRSDGLGPEQAFPRLGVGIGLGADTPDLASLTATVTGGGDPDGAGATGEFDYSAAAEPFGFMSMDTIAVDELGGDYTQAGGHPWAASGWAEFTHKRKLVSNFIYQRVAPVEHVKQLRTDTPAGFVGNPLAPTELCDDPKKTIEVLACPAGSAVGWARYIAQTGSSVGNSWSGRFALYALEPERGKPAQFAFGNGVTKGVYVVNARLRPEDGYAVSIDTAPIVQNPEFLKFTATICSYGAPVSNTGGADAATACREPGDPGAFAKPLLTNPTACSETPPVTRMSADSWENPGVFASAEQQEPLVTGCDQVPFDPTVSVGLTSSAADGASGLDASISIPSDGLEDPDGVSQAHLKKTVVELPDGVSVNPSAATGLQGCTDAQLGLGTDSEPACPDGSKIANVEATTPVLEETLSGVMVLRTPKSTDPTSGEMFRMALIVRNRERGILVKLPGSAVANPQSGKVTATFDDNPQLPIGTVDVQVKGGDRGVLAMPQDCGQVSTKASLTPWSGGADAVSDTASDVGENCGERFAPALAAGNSTQAARESGTFSFEFSRQDGEQWLRGLTAKLPKGLLASVRHVDLCSNAQADAGTCPLSSQIGVVDAKAGSGDPFVLEEKGRVYLTEGYKGGPYGLAVEIHPIAGPFRGAMALSPIIVRQAIHVDRKTAQVTAVSDPFPLIHHGVPLRVREVTVKVDRSGFMLNPSDCSGKQVGADILSAEGATASPVNHFQATGCKDLRFKPRLALALKGRRQVRTGKHPAIRAVVRQKGVKEAGIEKAVVRLPKSLALDVDNAQALCEFEDGTKPDLENHCPKGAIVGRARAKTPLLKDDLVGNVYFVKNVRIDEDTGNEIRTLPMIVVALRGEIAVNLIGESSTTKSGKLVNTFDEVPDAPISRFNLNIRGGKNGILAVTRTRQARINLCAKPNSHIAEADMDGHNGKRHDDNVRMKTPCRKTRPSAAKVCRKRTNNKQAFSRCVTKVKRNRAQAKRRAAKKKAAKQKASRS